MCVCVCVCMYLSYNRSEYAHPFKDYNKIALPLYKTLSDLLTRNEGSQTSPACPSGKWNQVPEDEC